MGLTLDKQNTGAGRQFLFLLLNGLYGNTVLWCLTARPHEAEQPDTHCCGQITNAYSTDFPFLPLLLVSHSCPLRAYSSMNQQHEGETHTRTMRKNSSQKFYIPYNVIVEKSLLQYCDQQYQRRLLRCNFCDKLPLGGTVI